MWTDWRSIAKNRHRHPGNEDEYHHMREKLAEEQNKGRGAQGAFNQERATCDQRQESESRERQKYAREREEQIDFEQSEPYPLPISEPDPPAQPEPSSQGGAKPKTKVSLEDYRNRQLQKEAAKVKEECDQESRRLLEEEQRQRESVEAKKVEQARLHEIKIRQAEVARIETRAGTALPGARTCAEGARGEHRIARQPSPAGAHSTRQPYSML